MRNNNNSSGWGFYIGLAIVLIVLRLLGWHN